LWHGTCCHTTVLAGVMLHGMVVPSCAKKKVPVMPAGKNGRRKKAICVLWSLFHR